jgi:hypothetical protein
MVMAAFGKVQDGISYDFAGRYNVEAAVCRTAALVAGMEGKHARIGNRSKMRIRPVGRMAPSLTQVPVRQAKTYTGDAIPLGYLGDALETNEIVTTSDFGDVHAAFNNGIIAGQWLRHAMEDANKPFNKDTLIAEVEDRQSPISEYLYGDVLSFLRRLIDKANNEGGKVFLALYELDDEELIDLLIANNILLEIILPNSSANRETHEWDKRNARRPGRN